MRRLDRMAALGEVAQLVEHATENRGVAGSIPALAIHAMDTSWTLQVTSPVILEPARDCERLQRSRVARCLISAATHSAAHPTTSSASPTVA